MKSHRDPRCRRPASRGARDHRDDPRCLTRPPVVHGSAIRPWRSYLDGRPSPPSSRARRRSDRDRRFDISGKTRLGRGQRSSSTVVVQDASLPWGGRPLASASRAALAPSVGPTHDSASHRSTRCRPWNRTVGLDAVRTSAPDRHPSRAADDPAAAHTIIPPGCVRLVPRMTVPGWSPRSSRGGARPGRIIAIVMRPPLLDLRSGTISLVLILSATVAGLSRRRGPLSVGRASDAAASADRADVIVSHLPAGDRRRGPRTPRG